MLLVVRQIPSPSAVVLDRWTGGEWRRGGFVREVPWSGANRLGASFPESRLGTLQALRTAMPSELPREIERALDHYGASVHALRSGHMDTALVSAALALESLLGRDLSGELSFRLSLRGAMLTANAADTQPAIFERLRKLYSERSKVVHAGAEASFESATHLQQFLMRAIPAMVALVQNCGSFRSGIEALDSSVLGADEPVRAVQMPGNWWSYVDVASSFAYVPVRPWGHEVVFLHDY